MVRKHTEWQHSGGKLGIEKASISVFEKYSFLFVVH